MGVYLSQPNENKKTIYGEGNGYQYCASGMQGWRTSMEDAHICQANLTPDVSIFGVFDGHGGREIALFVEKHFCEELLNNEAFQKNDFKTALEQTFLKMDELLIKPEVKQELFDLKNDKKDLINKDYQQQLNQFESYAGCTANIALIYKKEKIYVANAGDSRCIICTDNRAEELSIDHKPELEQERDRIIKAGGYISDGRINSNLNLSRAIGDLEYKKDKSRSVKEQLIIAFPEIHERVIQPEDQFLLIGCDGIWETLTNQEIVEFIIDQFQNKKNDLKSTVENLLTALLAKDTSTGLGCDNMSTVLIMLKQN